MARFYSALEEKHRSFPRALGGKKGTLGLLEYW